MCEYCARGSVSGKVLDAEEGLDCKAPLPDEAGGKMFDLGLSCGKSAVYRVRDRHVEDHVCDEHTKEGIAALHSGLGDFQRSFGLQMACEFLPIGPGETCDQAVGNPLLGESMERCGAPATHAKVVVEEDILCAEHAEEFGFHPSGGADEEGARS